MIDRIISALLNRYVAMAFISVAVLIIVLRMGFYVIENMATEIPNVEQVGAPLIIPWKSYAIIIIISLITGIIIAITDGGINPGGKNAP